MSEGQDSNMSALNDPPPPYEPPTGILTSAPSAQSEIPQGNTYHVFRTSFGNYNFILQDKTFAFYVKNRTFRTPSLTIHRGNGAYDREVANCAFAENINHFQMCVLRVINNKSSAILTRMTPDKCFSAKVPVLDGLGATVQTTRPFQWRQAETLTLVDRETEETFAAMHDLQFGVEKCFVLRTQAQYGFAFEILAVTSAITIYESQRRGLSSQIGSSHSQGTRSHYRHHHHHSAGIGAIGGAASGGGGGC